MVKDTLDLIDVVHKHLEQASPDLLRDVLAVSWICLLSADANAALRSRLCTV